MKTGRRPERKLLCNFKKKWLGIRAAYARRVSERRARAPSQYECREGPTAKVPVIILNRLATVRTWNVRLYRKSLAHSQRGQIAFVAGKTCRQSPCWWFLCGVYQHCSNLQTTFCFYWISTRNSWFLNLINISWAVKQLQQQPSLKSVTSDLELRMHVPSQKLIQFYISVHAKSSLHIQRPMWFVCKSCSSKQNRTSESFFSKLKESQQGKEWWHTAYT